MYKNTFQVVDEFRLKRTILIAAAIDEDGLVCAKIKFDY